MFTAGGPLEPKCEFVYDALYRLKKATGRTHKALNEGTYRDPGAFKQSKWTQLNDLGQLRTYTRKYTYDDAGNLHDIKQCGRAAEFRRTLDVDTNTNRALLHEDNVTPDFAGSFDANGNQVKMDHLGTIVWNFRDNIASVTMIDRGDNGPNNAEYYVYDASGQRVRKVTERLASGIVEVEEKIYLGGVEIKRFHKLEDGSLTTRLERYDLHVMDDKQRIAVVNHWTKDDLEREVEKQGWVETNRVRYQYGNHLGSASLELAGDGRFISYEEYFPYGGTAFITGRNQTEVKLKEYRYTGKERDDTTGFYYHGARYYAPWLGRWLSPDPAGPVDGWNLYQYVSGNPVKTNDPSGREEWDSQGPQSIWTELNKELGIDCSKDPPITDLREQAEPADKTMSKREARKAANKGAAEFRRKKGLKSRDVQAAHTLAARHAPESGVKSSDMNNLDTFQELHSAKDKGLNVTIQDNNGKITETTRHVAQEGLIDEAVDRVRQSSPNGLTPQGQIDAAKEVRWRTENVPMEQSTIDEVRGTNLNDRAELPKTPKKKATVAAKVTVKSVSTAVLSYLWGRLRDANQEREKEIRAKNSPSEKDLHFMELGGWQMTGRDKNGIPTWKHTPTLSDYIWYLLNFESTVVNAAEAQQQTGMRMH